LTKTADGSILDAEAAKPPRSRQACCGIFGAALTTMPRHVEQSANAALYRPRPDAVFGRIGRYRRHAETAKALQGAGASAFAKLP